MANLKLKGHNIEKEELKDSFNRRAVQFQNRIIAALKKAGIKKDQVDVPLEAIASKRAKASATWYGHNHRMYYSSNLHAKFVDNLEIVTRLLEAEANLVELGEKTTEQFIEEFREEEDVEEKREEAREFLGVEKDSIDIEHINRRYKELVKEHHPDTPTGSTEKFKKLNTAHKILKRELT